MSGGYVAWGCNAQDTPESVAVAAIYKADQWLRYYSMKVSGEVSGSSNHIFYMAKVEQWKKSLEEANQNYKIIASL
jgi:hypothetical protein